MAYTNFKTYKQTTKPIKRTIEKRTKNLNTGSRKGMNKEGTLTSHNQLARGYGFSTSIDSY